MKRHLVVLVALVALVVCSVSVASAAPYVSGNLGAVWAEDSDFSASEGGASVDADISFDTGYGVSAAFGNAFDNGFRAEVELGYRSNDMDDLSGTAIIDGYYYYGSGSIDGDVSTMSIMLNAFYDFMPKDALSPFIGAGIGYANVEGDLDELGSEDDNVIAYQVSAGVAFAVNKQLKFDVQYRYFATDDPEFGGVDFEYATHNLMFGLRYSF